MKVEILTFSRVVRATPAMVFRAWTRAGALREWLCDGASVDANPGGRYVLWWNDGYISAGTVESMEPLKQLSFTWRGTSDPGPTSVTLELQQEGGSVRLQVSHHGISSGEEWAAFREEITRGWEMGLENLQSALETGEDLRMLRRPMMGIMVGEYTAAVAEKLGLVGIQGVRLDAVSAGLAAEQAGLRKDDVITAIGGHPVTGLPSLTEALAHHRPGESVQVEFWRDAARQSADMVLSPRRLPPVPEEPADLARQLRSAYEIAYGKVAEWLAPASEKAARGRPAPGEWSALETVAHLIDSERELQIALIDAVNDDPRSSDLGANPTAVEAHVSALAAVHDTPASMLRMLRNTFDETIACVERLPPSLVERRATYLRLARELLVTADHTDDHVAQIRDALLAAAV